MMRIFQRRIIEKDLATEDEWNIIEDYALRLFNRGKGNCCQTWTDLGRYKI